MSNTDGTGPRRELTPEQRNFTKASGGDPGAIDLLKYARDAERINTQFTGELRSRWERSYRAFRSEHFTGSKYRLKAWESRSKLFRPKTRAAVRQAMTTAATALFSSADIITIEATRKSDPMMSASAAVLQELLSYRLDRTTPRGGLPWFLVTMGSVFNAQVTGVTVSKQYWDYRTKKRTVPRLVPATDEYGLPAIHPETGETIMRRETVEEMAVTADRPMVDLIPSENVLVDLAAPWYDVAQLSAYFVVKYPMLVGDFKAMARSGDKPGASMDAGVQWLDVDPAALNAVQEDYDAMGVRLARSGGQDPKSPRREGMNNEFGIVWIHENFFRYNGEDYHFWSVGTDIYASMPIPTERAYPHLKGDRPYIFGYGAIEPHLVYPMSAVESWQPLQQEANDVVNLRLDGLKQAIEPLAVVKRGSLMDLTQLQPGRRGAPGSVVQVNDVKDLDFAQWPAPPGQAYAEMQHINADFDELAGVFSGSSVNTNRSLNETVGGMRLLNASAGSVKEFDLRVWVETWVEPVLRQVVKLEQYYESDEEILAIAGEKADILERFGVSELTDQHLTREVSTKVNVGIGASDPMEKMQKVQMGLTAIGSLVPFFDRPVKVKAPEMIGEIMGLVGHKDGVRFFEMGQPGEGGNPEADAAAAASKADQETKLMLEQMRAQSEQQLAAMNNASAEERERMKGQIQLLTTMLSLQGRQQEMHVQGEQAERGNAFQHMSQMMLGGQKGQQAKEIAASKPAPAGAKGKAAGPSLSAPMDSRAMTTIGDRLAQMVKGIETIGQRLGDLESAVDGVIKHQNATVETGSPMAMQ